MLCIKPNLFKKMVVPFVIWGVCQGCSPVFSDLQSAKLVGQNEIEVTPHASAVFLDDDEDDNSGLEHYSSQVGLQFAYGVNNSLDFRLRYELVRPPGTDGEWGLNIFGFGPKTSLVTDRIALFVPIGFAWGADIKTSESWQIHPTLLFTTVQNDVEINASTKLMVALSSSGADPCVAFNAGLGFPGVHSSLVFRPEIGVMFSPGNSGHLLHISLGVTYSP